MTDSLKLENADPEASTTTAIRIAHLSDLHFGVGFNEDLWNDLARVLETYSPHILVISGDLVNSPFRWSLKRACKHLETLSERITTAAKGNPISSAKYEKCELVVIPGNHDVRLMGILAISWIKWLALMLGLTVYFLMEGGLSFDHRALILQMVKWDRHGAEVAMAVTLSLWTISLLLFRDFARALKEKPLQGPAYWTALGLAIYPFDSASRGARWARGKLGRRELGKATRLYERRPSVEATAERLKLPEPLYRIAVVHHHPLPIPYDTSQEAMMIMEDAGAFLSEISGVEISLVLHGHKHHHHFSRVTINAGTAAGFEVSVLSAGSATAGNRQGRFGFNFNLITIEGGNARVYPWVASGGNFKRQEPFWAHEPEDAAYRTYVTAARSFGYSAQSITSMTNINADGDMRHVTEVRGFKIEPGGEPREEFPYPVRAMSQLGTIEHFEAYVLAPSTATGLRMRPDTEGTPNRQSGFGIPASI